MKEYLPVGRELCATPKDTLNYFMMPRFNIFEKRPEFESILRAASANAHRYRYSFSDAIGM